MLIFVNWGLMAIIIFMVAGLYGRLDQIARSVAALRKAVAPAPAAEIATPAPPPIEG